MLVRVKTGLTSDEKDELRRLRRDNRRLREEREILKEGCRLVRRGDRLDAPRDVRADSCEPGASSRSYDVRRAGRFRAAAFTRG